MKMPRISKRSSSDKTSTAAYHEPASKPIVVVLSCKSLIVQKAVRVAKNQMSADTIGLLLDTPKAYVGV